MTVTDSSSSPYSRLRTAIETDDGAMAVQALADGAPCEKLDRFGMRPIHMAAAAGHPQLLKILIEHGAKLGARSQDGETIFDFIVSADTSPEKLQEFLDVACEWDFEQFRNSRGQSPLHTAARDLLTPLCKVLLAAGSDPNGLDHAGNNTAHCVAAMQKGPTSGAQALLELLAAHGVDFRHRAQQGRTPFLQACVTGSAEVVGAFLKVNPKGSRCEAVRGMELACEYDNPESGGVLLSLGLIRPDSIEYFLDLAEEKKSGLAQNVLRNHLTGLTLEQEIAKPMTGSKPRI